MADDDVVFRPITNLMRMRMPRELWDRWQDARSAAHHTKVAHAVALERLKEIEREIAKVGTIEVGRPMGRDYELRIVFNAATGTQATTMALQATRALGADVAHSMVLEEVAEIAARATAVHVHRWQPVSFIDAGRHGTAVVAACLDDGCRTWTRLPITYERRRDDDDTAEAIARMPDVLDEYHVHDWTPLEGRLLVRNDGSLAYKVVAICPHCRRYTRFTATEEV